MKIWVDDIRNPPDEDWLWAKTSGQALAMIQLRALYGYPPFEIMSLDHDLGGDDTTRPIVLWHCEYGHWPLEVRVHSANPVGVEWLEGMIERYKSS